MGEERLNAVAFAKLQNCPTIVRHDVEPLKLSW